MGDNNIGHGTLPRQLMLFPGPIYDLGDYFRARLTGISDFCRGTVLTTGPTELTTRFSAFEVHTVSCTSPGWFTTLRLLRSAVSKARNARREGDPFSVVVTYDPLKTGLIAWFLARVYDGKLIVEVNGDYSARANYIDIGGIWQRWLKRFTLMWVERFVLARADAIKLLHIQQIAAFRGLDLESRAHVFPNFTELAGFENRGESLEILFVGFPFYRKGVDILINAFKRVAPAFPNWRLKILGWYPDKRRLDSAIAGHPRIEHHPPVSHTILADHMGRCGIFVLPSRSEAMGRVLLEAMAARKPRIGAAVGGIPNVIRDEEDGLLFKPEDVDDLARALERLMSDASLRGTLGERAEARAHEEFSIERYCERVEALLCDVLGDGTRPASAR